MQWVNKILELKPVQQPTVLHQTVVSNTALLE